MPKWNQVPRIAYFEGGYVENKKRSSVEGTPPKGGYQGI